MKRANYNLRWSLRTMLLVVTGACVLASWFEYRRVIARREQRVVELWRSLGDAVELKLGPTELVRGPGGPADRQFERRKATAWEDFEIRCFGSPHLSAILIKRRCVVDEKLLDCLPDAVHLSYLQIAWTDANRDHLIAISNMSQLEGLELAGVESVDDDALKLIAELKGLRVLGLGGTNVTDTGMQHLSALSKLEWLSVTDTRISGIGLLHVADLPNLVYVSGNWDRYDRDVIYALDERRPKFYIPDVYGWLLERKARSQNPSIGADSPSTTL